MQKNISLRSTTVATLVVLGCLLLPANISADQVNWSTDVESALRSANDSDRLVLMKFTADWCGYCKKMERETFTRPAVAQMTNEQFVPVLVDADKHKELVRHLKIKGLPAILIVSPDMVILKRISGFQNEEKLLPQLQTAMADFRQPTPAVTASVPTRPVSQPNVAISPPRSSGNPFVVAPQTQPPAAVADTPAFGGLCLPSVKESRSLVSGTPEFAVKYHGKILYFRDQGQLQKFRTEPGKYWPMIDGACPVSLSEQKQQVEGKMEFAAMFRGKLWLCSSAETMKTFVARPAIYAAAATPQSPASR